MKLQEIAERLGAALEGDGGIEIVGISGVRDARAGELTFVAQPRYAAALAETRAAAALVPPDWNKPASCALLRVDRPEEAFARVAADFAPAPVRPPPGVHPTAVVAPEARLGTDVRVGPHCVIEPGAEIGDRTVLFAGVYVGHETRIGPDGLFYPHVTVRERIRIGARAIVHPGVVIGADGFGYEVDAQGVRTKIPQIGTVTIGDDVEIGANTTIDRARFGRTVIGNGVKIDNLVQIAHNCTIGDHAVIVAQVGLSGSVAVGARAVLAGQTGVAGHLTIGEGAVLGAKSGVTKSVPAGAFYIGAPAGPAGEFAKTYAMLQRIGEYRKRIEELEKRLARLEAGK